MTISSKEQAYGLIAAINSIDAKFADEKAMLMTEVDALLTEFINPTVEKRTRNTSGVVQVDDETGKEIARFKTIKEANIALGKPEKATGIGDAASGRTATHRAYGFKWYHIDEFDAQ